MGRFPPSNLRQLRAPGSPFWHRNPMLAQSSSTPQKRRLRRWRSSTINRFSIRWMDRQSCPTRMMAPRTRGNPSKRRSCQAPQLLRLRLHRLLRRSSRGMICCKYRLTRPRRSPQASTLPRPPCHSLMPVETVLRFPVMRKPLRIQPRRIAPTRRRLPRQRLIAAPRLASSLCQLCRSLLEKRRLATPDLWPKRIKSQGRRLRPKHPQPTLGLQQRMAR